MITYSVSGDQTPIQFGLKGVDAVKQNIRTIVTTFTGTCPFDREFGIDADIIDLPTPVATALLEVNIISAIEKYEPRATVTNIEINVEEGKLIPVIKFILNEEV